MTPTPDPPNHASAAAGPTDHDPVIYRYTRQQALDDGVLIDLTPWARETGITLPVACTAAVWHEYIVPPDGTESWGQSERGRGHDVLFLLWHAIRVGPRDRSEILYPVRFLMKNRKHRTVTLKAVCGPGDRGEPVITVMGETED